MYQVVLFCFVFGVYIRESTMGMGIWKRRGVGVFLFEVFFPSLLVMIVLG